MRKVLFVINNLNIGGIQKSLVNLLNEIANEYDISLVVFSEEGELFNELPSNIKIIKVNKILKVLGLSQKEVFKEGLSLWLLRTVGAIYSRIFTNASLINILTSIFKLKEEFDYAISYSQFSNPRYFSGGTNEYVLNSVNAKFKIAFIHSDFKNYGGNSKYTRKKYKQFNKIAFCSKSSQKSFLQIMPEMKYKTFVVKNFNSYNEIKKLACDNTVKYRNNIFNLISISRLSAEKGIDRAIKAVANCLKLGVEINYYIIGDGPERKKLMDLVNECELNDKIIFLGENINPYRFLPNADLLLFPSIHEAAGLVIEEAASLGIPVLSSKTISSKEMILDNDFGWVSENNQDAFNKYLYYLLNNKDILLEKKRLIKMKKFNNQINIKQFQNLLTENR